MSAMIQMARDIFEKNQSLRSMTRAKTQDTIQQS